MIKKTSYFFFQVSIEIYSGVEFPIMTTHVYADGVFLSDKFELDIVTVCAVVEVRKWRGRQYVNKNISTQARQVNNSLPQLSLYLDHKFNEFLSDGGSIGCA